MYLPDTMKELSVEELIPYCELYQNYRRLHGIMSLLLPTINDGFEHSGVRTEVTRKDNVLTIKIFQYNEIYAISTMPWYDDLMPDADSAVRSFAIATPPHYVYYGHMIDDCVCDLHMEHEYLAREYFNEITKEIIEAITEDFDIDTSRLHYFNPTVFHILLEERKRRNDDDEDLTSGFFLINEEDYGPNGDGMEKIKQLIS